MLQIIAVGKNPVEFKKGDLVKITAPGLPGHGKTGRILSSHGNHFQIESGPTEHKNYMHPANRLTLAKRNPKRKKRMAVKRKAKVKRKRKIICAKKNPPVKRRHETIIAGLVKVGKKYKRFYYTGKGFSRDRGEAKTFQGDMGKIEAKRILPMLPARIERLYVEKA